MPPDVRQPQGARVFDQGPEDAAAARKLTDVAVGLIIDAGGDESGEFGAWLVEHSEGGVLRPGEAASLGQDLIEDPVRIKLGDERLADVEQPTESIVGRREVRRVNAWVA